MNRVTTEHAFFSEMPEFRVANRADAASMIHGVTAHSVEGCGFHNDIAAEIGNFAAEPPFGLVFELRRLLENDGISRRLCDFALFRLGIIED